MNTDPFKRKTGDDIARECLQLVRRTLSVRVPGQQEPLPGSRWEVERAGTLLQRAANAGPRQPELLASITRLRERVRRAARPRFAGSTPLLAALLASLLLQAWLWGVQPLLANLDPGELAARRSQDITATEAWLAETLAEPRTPTTRERARLLRQRIADLRQGDDEAYRREWVAASRERGTDYLKRNGAWLGLALLLLPASFAPGYIVLKRRAQMRAFARRSSPLPLALAALLAPLAGQPPPPGPGDDRDQTGRLARLVGLLGLLILAAVAARPLLLWLLAVSLLRNPLHRRTEEWADRWMARLTREEGSGALSRAA
jgi:hypothetical protein